jgi:hypothetical protein
MGYGQAATDGGRRAFHKPHFRGVRLAAWGLFLLALCTMLNAVGLGGSGSSGVLFLGIFIGLGMVLYGLYLRAGGLSSLPGWMKDGPGSGES